MNTLAGLEQAERQALLSAVVDCILPPVDGYGGVQAGVPDYLEPYLDGGDDHGQQFNMRAQWLNWGLGLIQDECRDRYGAGFANCDDQQRVSLLTGLTSSGNRQYGFFWRILIELSLQGFLSDPIHGGNRDGGAWRVVGFSTSSGTTNPSVHPGMVQAPP